MADNHGNIVIDNLDKERFSKDIEIVKNDKAYLQEISDKICSEYTIHIDKVMQRIYTNIQKKNLSDADIEKDFVELTNLIYFLGDKMESLGMEQTVASARNQEIYNKVYQAAEGTIKDKQAVAEDSTKYEYFLKAVYDSVYKRIKLKMDAAYEMVSSLKYIIKKKTAEIGLSQMKGNYNGTRAAMEDRD